jgi:hypothetical protein
MTCLTQDPSAEHRGADLRTHFDDSIDGKPGATRVLPFNVFKYGPREGGGLAAQQYAPRDYEAGGG